MNLQLTDDRRVMGESLSRFLVEHYGQDVRDRTIRARIGHDQAMWRRFADTGAIGLMFDESVGGFGGTPQDLSVVFESLGRALVLEPFLPVLMAGRILGALGSISQQAIIPEMIDGRRVATLAHRDPGQDWDAGPGTTRAIQEGDEWRIRGRKQMVPCGAQAHWVLVTALTPAVRGHAAGASFFLIPSNAPGMHWHDHALFDGGRAADLHVDNVRVPARAMVGAPGAALPVLRDALTHALLASCADALGAMESCREITTEYLRARRQFGQPLGSFQAMRHRLVDVALAIEQCRSAVMLAAESLSRDASVEQARRAAQRRVDAAKFSLGRHGARVAEACIQMHGANGLAWDAPISHYAKRLMMLEHLLGGSDEHLLRYCLGTP